jgi:hypothetical protein
LCSASRLDAAFQVRRIDTTKSRLFCWLQTHVADHSALFSFFTTRIQRNPGLVKALGGLGAPKKQTRPLPSETSAPDRSSSPSSSPPSTAGGPTSTSGGPTSTSTPGPPRSGSTFAPGDYEHQLTSALVLVLDAVVRTDGAKLAVVGETSDLAALDVLALVRAGVTVIPLDESERPSADALRFPNDGHYNRLGHRRTADFLAPRLSPLLSP